MRTCVFKEEVFYLRNAVQEAASVMQICYSGALGGEDRVKGVWRHEEGMPYTAIADVYFVQRIAELGGAGHAISKSFTDLMRFPKKLVENAEFPRNYERMSLHMCTG